MNELLEKYSITRTLGEGSCGQVKFGICNQTNKEVAIKIIEKKNINNKKILQRELYPVYINHINVQKIIEFINNENYLFIILDLATGLDLYEHILNNNLLSENEARRMFKQLILAVEACHTFGIVHRDIKLENILIRHKQESEQLFVEPGTLILTDFGLSNFYIDENKNKFLLKTPCGSEKYAAPELVGDLDDEQDNEYNPCAIDIWSIGIVLYLSLIGAFPFIKATDTCEIYQEYKTNKYILTELTDNFSNSLSTLLFGILTINPEKRLTIPQIKSSDWWTESGNNIFPPEV